VKEEIQELTDSVKQYGVLEPIIVAHTPAGYQIIAGERRWRAAKQAGLTEVPVVIKETTPKGMLEMAVIENVQRVDLSAIERAQAFRQLQRDFKYTTSQIAEKVGKSIPYVSNTMNLLKLPDAIKDGLVGGQITEGHARALSAIDDERGMIECYKIVLKQSASVRATEEMVRRFKAKMGEPSKAIARGGLVTNQQIDDWQNALQALFDKKSKVKLMRSERQTKVMFIFKGSPEQTQAQLDKIIALTK
jgi:ParB family chromosome partitioning protein